MAPPRHINIGPYSFPLRAGYSDSAEGFDATGVPEREVLDQARAERVRKKAFRVYEKMRLRSGRRTLSEAELRLLTDEIAEMDRAMRLERHPDPRGPDTAKRTNRVLTGDGADVDGEVSDFDRELTHLAEMKLAAEEVQRGATVAPEARAAALEALRQDSALREVARQRIEAGLRERDRLLAELF